MGKRITYLLLTALLSCYVTAGTLSDGNRPQSSFKAPSSKTLYGFLYYDYDYGTKGFVSFNTSSTSNLEMFGETSKDICAGAYAENTYYAYFTEYDDDYGGYVPVSLSKVDMKTGNATQIVAINPNKPLLDDMTYDYSSQTMYGIRPLTGLKSALVKLNLTTGQITDVAPMEQRFMTLACTYSGTLYGVSASGNFYQIDKTNGTTTFIGETEEEPYAKQSMEFDHGDNTLYWLCNNSDYQSFLAKVDINTGNLTKIGNLGDHAQLTGLYIPFDNINAQAPAKITDFQVKPSENGVLSANLSWTNPTKNYSGSTLSTINKIEIYRNGTLIHNSTNTTPGNKVNWTDNVTVKEIYSYKIVPVNNAGSGPGSSLSTYIGKDLPGAVSNLTLTAENNTGKLAWTAPVKGLNEGWFDASSLKYKIVRLPDNIVLSENIQGTSYTDITIKSQDQYSYQVISVNSEGEGGSATSNVVMIGSGIHVPYYFDFETTDKFQLWTVIDANNDNYKWKIDSESLTSKNHIAQYAANRNKSADDWMLTPPIHLEAGKNYTVKFKVSSFGENYPENLTVTIGKGVTAESQTKKLAEYKRIINKQFELKTIKLTISETGTYNLGFYCDSPAGGLFLFVDDFSIEEHGENDLAATAVKGNLYPLQNKKYDYTITVKNVGEVSQNHYTVKLLDNKDNTLASSEFNDSLEPGQEKDFIVSWTPIQTGSISIRGSVEIVSDINQGNNNTAPLAIEVRPEGGIDLIQIGSEKNETNSLPINFSFKTSASQTIYLQKELDLESGIIKKIIYPYSFSRDDIAEKPMKIYLANTFESSLKEDFIPGKSLTLVFDGKISMPKNKKQLEIELTTPFLYSGQNLVVMCERVMDVDGYMPGSTYTSPAGNDNPNRTRVYSDDLKSFTFQPKAGKVFNVIPNILLGIDTESGGIISGTMIDDYEDAVSGATIKITSLNAIAKTDDEGNYQFRNIPEGTYKLSMQRTGYYDFEWPDVKITNGQTTRLYLEMERMGKCTVSGTISDPDGKPLPGAQIKISGYADFSTKSDQNGAFEIEKVYVNSTYTITVASADLAEYTANFSTSEEDKNLGNIKMSDIALPVCNITSTDSENGKKLQWDLTSSLKNFRRDDGSVNSQLNAGANNPYQIFGTLYKEYTILYNMSWQTTDNTCKHDKVNVFVFALNENGEPTTEILYSKENVPNTDWKWCTHTFETPVEAPNGFLVALTSDLPLDIAIDSGNDKEYPFIDNTNYSGNYKMGIFAPLEALSYFENFHLRAEGAVKSETRNNACKGYDIWRLKSGQESTPDKWTKLTSEPVAEASFIDSEWNQLEPGLYRFAIRSVYAGAISSPAVMSTIIQNKMLTQINLTVKTNTSGKFAKGAIVSLTNTDNEASHRYRAVTDESGKVTFKEVWKGTYSLEIAHSDFEIYHVTNQDFSKENEYNLEISVKEKIHKPFNLLVKEGSEYNQRIFSWNVFDNLFDDFEKHTDFAINSAGETGWQYIDGDGQNTINIGNIDFPSNGAKMAYTIFNPSSTSPSLGKDQNSKPYSGSKYLGCFSNKYIANDDYFISPQLSFDTDFIFRFMAKSYISQYQLSEMQIGYSLSGKEKNDFIWITATPVKVDATAWTKYQYNIPARASYVAVKCVSVNAFMLMIDDVFIGKEGISNSSTRYEVYLDGQKMGETTQTSFTFDNLDTGKYKAGVKALYETGNSETVTLDFEVKASGIESEKDSEPTVTVFPNPVKDNSFTVNYPGTLKEPVILYNSSGLPVKQINTDHLPANSSLTISVNDLNPGIYLLKVCTENGYSMIKIIIG